MLKYLCPGKIIKHYDNMLYLLINIYKLPRHFLVHSQIIIDNAWFGKLAWLSASLAETEWCELTDSVFGTQTTCYFV